MRADVAVLVGVGLDGVTTWTVGPKIFGRSNTGAMGLAVLYLRGGGVGVMRLVVFSLRGGGVGVTGLAGLYLRGGRVGGVGLAMTSLCDAGVRYAFNIPG